MPEERNPTVYGFNAADRRFTYLTLQEAVAAQDKDGLVKILFYSKKRERFVTLCRADFSKDKESERPV